MVSCKKPAPLKLNGRLLMRSIVSVVVPVLFLTIPIAAQNPGAKPSFEVSTIKRNTAVQGRSRQGDQPGGRFVANRVTLRTLIGFAYKGGIQGGPSWMDSDLWDVEAKAPEGAVPLRTGPPDLNAPPGPMELMVQSLLEDRFQLKVHSETRELPIYELTIAKGGPKVKLSEDQSPPMLSEQAGPPPQRGGAIPRGAMRMGRGDFEVTAISFDNLAAALGALYLQRPAQNKTGLKGLYDIKLQWMPDSTFGVPPGPGGPVGGPELPPVDPAGATIFNALQEQLGLKLDSAKGPVEVLVIDGVQKPSDN
jgi:bla regulator protein blaR1